MNVVCHNCCCLVPPESVTATVTIAWHGIIIRKSWLIPHFNLRRYGTRVRLLNEISTVRNTPLTRCTNPTNLNRSENVTFVCIYLLQFCEFRALVILLYMHIFVRASSARARLYTNTHSRTFPYVISATFQHNEPIVFIFFWEYRRCDTQAHPNLDNNHGVILACSSSRSSYTKKNTQQIAIDHFFVFWQIKSNTHIQSRNADLIFFCGFAHGAPEARAEAKWIECRPHFFSFFGMNGVDVICGMLPPRRMQMCPQHKHRACLMWSFRKSFLFDDSAMLFLH